MWEVWSYPDYSYTEGEGTLQAMCDTLAEAESFTCDIKRPLRIVRVDYPATEHTAAEVIEYLEEFWMFYDHRDLIEDVKRKFNGR